jgi:hypothetical protein
VKVLRPEDVEADGALASLGPEAWPAAAARASGRGVCGRSTRVVRLARHLGHRALVGRRDPVDGPAVPVQARRRPRRRGRRGSGRGDDRVARSSTTSAWCISRPRTSCRCRWRSTGAPARRARAAADNRGGPLRGARCVMRCCPSDHTGGACSRIGGSRDCRSSRDAPRRMPSPRVVRRVTPMGRARVRWVSALLRLGMGPPVVRAPGWWPMDSGFTSCDPLLGGGIPCHIVRACDRRGRGSSCSAS